MSTTTTHTKVTTTTTTTQGIAVSESERMRSVQLSYTSPLTARPSACPCVYVTSITYAIGRPKGDDIESMRAHTALIRYPMSLKANKGLCSWDMWGMWPLALKTWSPGMHYHVQVVYREWWFVDFTYHQLTASDAHISLHGWYWKTLLGRSLMIGWKKKNPETLKGCPQ